MRRAAWMVAAVTGLVAVSGRAAAQQAPEPTEAEILAQFKFEPSVQEVQDAAIRYYQVHPDRIKSLRANAQLKALVPTITGGFNNQINSNNRNMMDGLYVKANPPLPYKEYEVNTGDSMGFTISATWMLDRLVFNAEVLDVQSLIGILDGVVREVTTVYYIRRRMQIDGILRPPQDLGSKISQNIRVEELTGLLDAMTGGFVSKTIRQRAAAASKRQLPTAPAPAKSSSSDSDD